VFLAARLTEIQKILSPEQAKDEKLIKQWEDLGVTPVLEIDESPRFLLPPMWRCRDARVWGLQVLPAAPLFFKTAIFAIGTWLVQADGRPEKPCLRSF
jgi:hypothetical protein